MSRIVVLGGCGAVGSVAAKALVGNDRFDEVVLGDINKEKADSLAKEYGKKASSVKVDAEDPESVKAAVKGADLVLNCTGPFYRFVKPVLTAVIDSGINYVDICDDFDVTVDILEMDGKAKEAGVTAMIGMGSSPGVTNVLGKFAAESLLDETESIDIFHAHGGEPFEGAGVIEHRFHCMTVDIPMYLDGKLTYVKYFEPDGIALREEFEFPVIGKALLYPYPHPEQITMPGHIKCRQVTNKGSVLPEEYYNLIRDMVKLGLASKEPVEVKGTKITPYDFSLSFIVRERDRILKEVDFGAQRGCVSVIVKGVKDGKRSEYRFHLASRSQALGEGTGLPAAMGAMLMHDGKVEGPGVMPPEACVNPQDFLDIVPQVMNLDEKKEGGERFGGVIVEHVDESGKVTKLDI